MRHESYWYTCDGSTGITACDQVTPPKDTRQAARTSALMAGWYIGDHVHMCPEHSFPYRGRQQDP